MKSANDRITEMKKYPNNFHFTSLQYIDLFNNLVNTNDIVTIAGCVYFVCFNFSSGPSNIVSFKSNSKLSKISSKN